MSATYKSPPFFLALIAILPLGVGLLTAGAPPAHGSSGSVLRGQSVLGLFGQQRHQLRCVRGELLFER